MEVILGRGLRFASILGSNPILITKSFTESVRCIQCTDPRRWKLKLTERYPRCTALPCNYVPLLNYVNTYEPFKCASINAIRSVHYSDFKQSSQVDGEKSEPGKKVSVFQKMKQLTKDYWHILIPVHLVTSVGWVGIFYLSIKNGVDIVKIMESMHFSEQYLDMLKNSSAGNWALTYAVYKIFTPLRYTVTVGGTTLAIRYLNKMGLLKASSFRKQPSQINKTAESNKVLAEHKSTFKQHRQTDPPKT